MELDKRDISALIEAYLSLGSILSGSLKNIDPDRVMGIKGQILKLSIHANYFKHMIQTLYYNLENMPPELAEEPEVRPQEEQDDSSARVGPEEDG